MAPPFEWDPAKAVLNLRKHGVSFDEAATVFGDPLRRTRPDQPHSSPPEERWVTVGRSLGGRTLVVAHYDTDDDVIRIIRARRATRSEREQYEEEGD